jgi:hypothetical protein
MERAELLIDIRRHNQVRAILLLSLIEAKIPSEVAYVLADSMAANLARRFSFSFIH